MPAIDGPVRLESLDLASTVDNRRKATIRRPPVSSAKCGPENPTRELYLCIGSEPVRPDRSPLHGLDGPVH